MSDLVVETPEESCEPAAAAGSPSAASAPGTWLAVVAVVSFVVCLAGFASRQVGVGVGAASVTLLAAGGALSWLTAQGRRFRDAQRIA